MRLCKVYQDRQYGRPDSDEEDNDENEDLPLRNVDAPQETPVATVRLSKFVELEEGTK